MNKNSKDIVIEFRENEILFPKGYYFKCSPIHKRKRINSEEISEVNLNTFPPTLVYQDKEVIFIEHKYKADLEQFAIQNKILLFERFDIWESINRPFLDTEFTKKDKIYTTKSLIENGVSKEEIVQIRKKIKSAMSLNFYAWEWIYLGLFDYLSWTFLTKKKYWWSMEIALRNYKKRSIENPK